MATNELSHTPRTGLLRTVLTIQAAYYIIAGMWPLIHMQSFLAVTGPKEDLWLVVTVGALLTAVGVAIVFGASRQIPRIETTVLAVGVALVLAVIEAVYVQIGRIAPIYLADAVVEVLLIAGVVTGWVRAFGSNSVPEREAETLSPDATTSR